MARPRRNTSKVYSSLSDDRLAVILARDFERSPSEFAVSDITAITDSKSFLHNTSARTIAPLKKWL